MDGFCWANHYAGMITDDKFLAAADMAGVNPLLPPVVFSALFERAIENHDGGSFAGFHPRVLAAKFRVAVEEVERTLAAFAELALIEGQRLVKWAKRQGAAAVAAVAALSTPRTRRFRGRQRDRRQGEMLLPIPGTRERVPTVPDVPDAVPEARGNAPETANSRVVSTTLTGNALDREREIDFKDSPKPPQVGAFRKPALRRNGTAPRQLAEQQALADEREEKALAARHLAWIIDRGARERQAGRWDDARMPQHLAAIRRRQAEMFPDAA